MKIKHNSTWLFFYKYVKNGDTPNDVCSWFWTSLYGLIIAIASPFMLIWTSFKKEYNVDNVYISMLIEVLYLMSVGIFSTDEQLSGWKLWFAPLFFAIIVAISITVIIFIIYLIDRIKEKRKRRVIKGNSPIKQVFKDFKEKHCTLIKIDYDD